MVEESNSHKLDRLIDAFGEHRVYVEREFSDVKSRLVRVETVIVGREEDDRQTITRTQYTWVRWGIIGAALSGLAVPFILRAIGV